MNDDRQINGLHRIRSEKGFDEAGSVVPRTELYEGVTDHPTMGDLSVGKIHFTLYTHVKARHKLLCLGRWL